MTLDETIKYYEKKAEELERSAKLHQRPDKDIKGSGKRYLSCLECANEYRQLAEWLKELKLLKQNIERQIKGAEEEIEDEYKKTPLNLEKIRTIHIYKECLKDVLYNEMDGVAESYKADMEINYDGISN